MGEQVALFSTLESVLERITSVQHASVEQLIFFINYGGIDNQKVLDSLELFATRVMPLCKE